MRVLLFAPGDDEALQTADWFAERCVAQLRLEVPGVVIEELRGADATRANLERAAAERPPRLLLCYTHGEDGGRRGDPVRFPRLMGAGERPRPAALDHANCRILSWRSLHAFACMSAALCPDAINGGVERFVGYVPTLRMAWNPPASGALPAQWQGIADHVAVAATRWLLTQETEADLMKRLFDLSGQANNFFHSMNLPENPLDDFESSPPVILLNNLIAQLCDSGILAWNRAEHPEE